MILGCRAGARIQDVARQCRTRQNTIIKRRDRFVEKGLAGLADDPSPGTKKIDGEDFRRRVLAMLEKSPPAGQAVWDGSEKSCMSSSTITARTKNAIPGLPCTRTFTFTSLQRRPAGSTKLKSGSVHYGGN